MKVWLIVDGATKRVRVVTRQPRPHRDPNPYLRRPSGPPGRLGLPLGATEMAFPVEIIVPGLWGTISQNVLEINLPTPIEVGIDSSPTVGGRNG